MNVRGGFGVAGRSGLVGVYGLSSANGPGVFGDSSAGSTGTGVYGVADGIGSIAMYGINITSGGGTGLYGHSPFGGIGVYGDSPGGPAVFGVSYGGGSTGTGVVGLSDEGTGVYGFSSLGPAGYFNGNVHVVGTLSKGAGAFKIDHPLDPSNKYLSHSFVESSDMKTIYDGVVVLDANGRATIALPAWFETLNRDFRYQLTAIGASAPNLYVAQKVIKNRFAIAGGRPRLEVSWQVTGVRHDPYAEQHRIPVEEQKSAEERGKYLHPKEYGQPETMAINYPGLPKLQEKQTEIQKYHNQREQLRSEVQKRRIEMERYEAESRKRHEEEEQREAEARDRRGR